jgi:hypothetical protein
MPFVIKRDSDEKEAMSDEDRREQIEITVREPIPETTKEIIERVNNILVYNNVTSLNVDYGTLRFTHYPYEKRPTEMDELIDWYMNQYKEDK